jgi:peroxiredoxin
VSASPASRTPSPERADAVGLTAHVLFVLVGGLLVFGFAWALGPAVEKQGAAACMPLMPDARATDAPELVGEDLNGNSVSLADLRGKFVVINFWATYCEPCTREWPELDRLAERFADRDDVVVLAVSVDDERAKIPPYLERMGLTETNALIWWDPSGEINKAFGSEKIPDTFFIDEAGTVVSAFINVREWGKPAAFHCVDSMRGR